jgi:uncharacterized membrane protein
MTFLGVLVFSIMPVASTGLVATGVVVLRKRTHWFIRAAGVICSLLGLSCLASVTIGFVYEVNPIPALLIQLGIAFGLTAFLFWVAMLVDCAVGETNESQRLLWVLIIILTNLVGALVYLLVRRPMRLQESMSLPIGRADKE